MLKRCFGRSQAKPKRTALELKQIREERYQRLIAFALPIFAFYLAFAAHGLWPFGNRHLLAYDLYHQYAPFLLELKRKILSGDTLFYSWSGGLGVNFYSFFTYYVASPFNLLVIFFRDQNIAEAVTLITLLKIGLSSLFFREFLTGAFRKRDPIASLFGGFYALSTWVFAYSWNIMWLDTLVFFPLACLGLVELIRDGKSKRFVFALTMMLLTNYYTAFFGCVFLLLYYFVLRIQFAPQSKRRLEPVVSFGKFAGYSVLSALLSGVVLWPTVRALSITSAAGDAFPQGFTFTQALLDTLGRLTPLREPNIMSGLPNIFAGMLVLLLVPAFFAAKDRPRRVRIAYGLLFGFLLFSFQSRTLSFLWHGGHYPNSLDFRYAFVFILLTLAMAYQALGDELALTRTPMLMTVVATFVLLLAEQRWQLNDVLSHWRLLVTLVFAIGYLMIFADFRKNGDLIRHKGGQTLRDASRDAFLTQGASYALTGRYQMSPRSRVTLLGSLLHKTLPPDDRKMRLRRVRHRRALAVLFLLVALELLFHAFTTAALYQQIAPLGDRSNYTSNEYATEIYGYADSLKRDNAGRPWRAEILPDTCVNDPFLFGTNGMSLFASPFPQASIAFFSNLGYQVNGVNSFQYKESTIVMDSVLSIGYLMVRDSRIFDDRIRKEVAKGEETRLLKNEDALSFGYFVTPEAAYLNDELMPEDAIDVQNRLVSALSGQPPVLIKEAFYPWGQEGCYVEPGYDSYSFRVERDENDSEWAFLVYDVPVDGTYYVFWEDETVGINYSNGYIRDEEFFHLGSGKQGIGDLGFLEAGSKLHFRVSMPSGSAIDGTFRACVGRLDEEGWQYTRESLASHPLELDHFSAAAFSGNITAPRNGYLFVPTTGNPGWTFTVDGTKTESTTIRGSFILIPLEAGTHTIKAKFVPVGFYTGLAMSLSGVALVAGLYLWKRKRSQ